jgi:diguanylate cyclase (GGDEF)-like protein
MLDLDRFSSFNNKYGHKLGDRVLVRFAESLQRELRQSDLIGRWGGEEFVVAYPGTPVTGALVALRKVASDMRASRVDDSCSDSVTFSGGLVEVRSDDALDDVLGRADDLLYAAKRQGRDRVLHVIPSDLVDKPAILVAEDDPTMAALLRHDLDGQYDVTQVSDGTDAVEAAAKRTFDLVLLDYEMPGMSGLDVLRHLRAQTAYKACPILMLTAAGADPLIEEAFQSGVDDYVTKPYSRRALLARIERHIGRQLD